LNWRGAAAGRFAVTLARSERAMMRTYEIDPEWFERRGRATRREFIGDLGAESGWYPNRSRDYSMEVIECQLITE